MNRGNADKSTEIINIRATLAAREKLEFIADFHDMTLTDVIIMGIEKEYKRIDEQ